ncbi:MAG: hypothetical protein U1C49_01235 [Candidatus Andersenbacteria bacterium]|nr:hypothetical protein [bacterium]MDZ4225449.1 hypothetical protein [Candidatus Andersenbacteria bacterium]
MTPPPFTKKFKSDISALLKRFWPYLVLLGFGLVVVWPWFSQRGFLFLLDFVSPPQLIRPPAPWQAAYLSGLPYRWLAWAMSHFLTTATTLKLLFSLPLFLAGISMYQLCRHVLRGTADWPALSALIAGVFYTYSPFVITRVFMGHVFLLYGYALVPWALLAWIKFQQRATTRRGLYTSLALAATVLVSIHYFILAPLLLLFFLRLPRRKNSQTFLPWLYLALPVSAVIAFSFILYRYIPFPQLNPVGPWARALLAPYSGSYIFDVLNLSATWKIDLPFLLSWELRPGFGLVSAVLLAVMTGGFFWMRRLPSTRWISYRLILTIFVGLFLAVGVAQPVTAPVAAWLYQHVPFWLGLRDSAKFISLIALAESILLAAGICALSAVWSRARRKQVTFLAPAIVSLLVLYLSSAAFYGFGNQLHPLSYPASWQQAQAWFSANHQAPPRTLFLPWHMYLPFSFTNYRTIANPARLYFTGADMISGNSNEVGGTFGRPFIYAENTDATHQYLQKALSDSPSRDDFGTRLAPLCIQYVMLATDTLDAADYNFLYRQKDLEIVFSQPNLTIWRNKTQATDQCSPPPS